MTYDKKLVQELTDLCLENGMTISSPAILKLAIYVIEREKLAIKSLIIKEK